MAVLEELRLHEARASALQQRIAELEAKVTAEEAPSTLHNSPQPPADGPVRICVPAPLDGGQMLGLSVLNLVVVSVDDPRASNYGWTAGDKILRLNGYSLFNDEQLRTALFEAIHSHRVIGSALVFDVWRPMVIGVAGNLCTTGQSEGQPPSATASPPEPAPSCLPQTPAQVETQRPAPAQSLEPQLPNPQRRRPCCCGDQRLEEPELLVVEDDLHKQW